jgi:hypothetical protein
VLARHLQFVPIRYLSRDDRDNGSRNLAARRAARSGHVARKSPHGGPVRGKEIDCEPLSAPFG